jgi:hypothetical protein
MAPTTILLLALAAILAVQAEKGAMRASRLHVAVSERGAHRRREGAPRGCRGSARSLKKKGLVIVDDRSQADVLVGSRPRAARARRRRVRRSRLRDGRHHHPRARPPGAAGRLKGIGQGTGPRREGRRGADHEMDRATKSDRAFTFSRYNSARCGWWVVDTVLWFAAVPVRDPWTHRRASDCGRRDSRRPGAITTRRPQPAAMLQPRGASPSARAH